MGEKQRPSAIAADRLRAFIETIEHLEGEKRAIADDIGNVYSEAKGVGFDVKTMRAIVKLRKMDEPERDEQEQLLDVYKNALGMGGGSSPAPLNVREIDEATVARATNEQALKAIRLLQDGKSIRQVADELKMGHGNVQRIYEAITARKDPVPEKVGTPEPAAAAVAPIPAQNIAPGDVPAAAGQSSTADVAQPQGGIAGNAAAGRPAVSQPSAAEAALDIAALQRAMAPGSVRIGSGDSPTAAAILATDAGPIPLYLRRVRA